jgi:hypothetical protein
MTLLTHTGRSFERVPRSQNDRSKAANAHLATIKRFFLIVLTAMLALSAVGAVIALKTVAYLSHFTH